jgi:hypothetical protein
MSMRHLNVRQGMIGGSAAALVSAAAAAGRSPDPLPTFASILAFAMVCVAAVAGLAVAVNRPPKPPVRW